MSAYQENRMKDNLNGIIFQSVQQSYLPGLSIKCLYKVSTGVQVGPQDHVALYPVGWRDSMQPICTQQAGPLLNGNDGSVTFPEHQLPKEDKNFYQFCYMRESGIMLGASTPFQFKGKSDEAEVVEEEGEDGIMIVMSREDVLQRDLALAEAKVETLQKRIEDMIEMQKEQHKQHLQDQELARQQSEKLLQKAVYNNRQLELSVTSQSAIIAEMEGNFLKLKTEKEKNEKKAKQQQQELQQQQQRLQKENWHFKDELNQKTKLVELRNSECTLAEGDLAKLRLRYREMEEDKVRVESRVEEVKKELLLKTKEAQRFSEESREAQLQLQEMGEQKARLEGHVERLRKEIFTKEQEAQRLLEENKEKEMRLKDHLDKEIQMQNQLDAVEASRELMKEEIETIKESHSAIVEMKKRKLEQLHATHSQTLHRLQELQESYDFLQEEHGILMGKQDYAEMSKQKLEKTIAGHTQALEEKEKEMTDLKAQRDKAVGAVEKFQVWTVAEGKAWEMQMKDLKKRLILAEQDYEDLRGRYNIKTRKLLAHKKLLKKQGRSVSPDPIAEVIESGLKAIRGQEQRRKPLVQTQNASQCVRLNPQPGKEGGEAHHDKSSVPKTPEELLAACRNIYPNPYILQEAPTAGEKKYQGKPLWAMVVCDRPGHGTPPPTTKLPCPPEGLKGSLDILKAAKARRESSNKSKVAEKTEQQQQLLEPEEEFHDARADAADAQPQCGAENIDQQLAPNIASLDACPYCEFARPAGLADESFLIHVEYCSGVSSYSS